MTYAVKDGRIQEVDDQEIDIELPSANSFLSIHGNTIPMQSGVQAPRVFYGSRFLNQALPLVNPEAPLVQTKIDGQDRSFDQELGKSMGAVFSDRLGRVLNVDQDHVELEDPETGETWTKHLYNNFIFNRKTSLHNTPSVKQGDMVEPGQLLARSNYTDDKGTLAMSVNARIGLVPYKGYSMDDAVVISQSLANRLTSRQTYVEDQEFDGDVKGGKNHFHSLFPTAFKQTQLKKLDAEGVALAGQILEKGDPYVLATKPRMFTSQAGSLGKLSRAMQQTRQDASLVWDHNEPGTVQDVVRTKKGVKVVIDTETPVMVGDKLTERHGNKCYHPDTELLTERGWVKVGEVTPSDKVASLFDDNEDTTPTSKKRRAQQKFAARFKEPMAVVSYNYDGELCGMETAHAAYLVTPNHRVWRNSHQFMDRWFCQDAKDLECTYTSFMHACDFDLSDRTSPEFFEIPQAIHGVTGAVVDQPCRFEFKAWVRFMAMYIAEGNLRHCKPNDHTIIITQKERPFCRIIESTIEEMGLKWAITSGQYRVGPNKALRQYLEQFGKAPFKFIPDEIKKASKEDIQLFLDTIWQCDGDKDKGKAYWTSSVRLADDMQHLLAIVGKAAAINKCKEIRELGNYHELCLWIREASHSSLKKDIKACYYREQYKGPVHCIQVPGKGVVLTRYKGKVMWNGNSIVSKILSDEEMPRTVDGLPLEMLLNPLGIPSRVNSAMVYDILLGKVAKKRGEGYNLPAFNKPGEKWYDFVEQQLAEHGIDAEERVFDPMEQRELENPITVGYAPVMKLHHMASSKLSGRSQGSYSMDEQPLKGGSDAAQAKRLSGLERNALISSGAYATLRESSTIRGQKCFDDQTEVLTESGWKLWKDVNLKDKLYTRNDDKAWFESPQALHVHDYNGPMYGYQSTYLDWLVTPNHRMLVKQFQGDKVPKFISAEETNSVWATQVSQFGWVNKGGLSGDYEMVFGDDDNYRTHTTRVNLMDYAEFMGWYLSEGCASIDAQGRGKIFLAQKKSVNEAAYLSIRQLMDIKFRLKGFDMKAPPSGVKVGHIPGEVTGRAYCSRPLAEHCLLFGTRAWNKTIPDIIFQGSVEVRETFLQAYLRGDGCIRTSKKNGKKWPSIVTTSLDVADGLQVIAISLGLRGIVYPIKRHKSVVGPRHQQYHICIGASGGWASVTAGSKPTKSLKYGYTQDYNGKVYCATMSTGLLYTRRNGKPLWSGNSDDFWKAVRSGHTPREPGSPFVWDKFQALLQGSGMLARDLGGGKLRLGPFTDKSLAELKPRTLDNADSVNPDTLEPVAGGLFDPVLVGGGRWGAIDLDTPVPNPAFEKQIAQLLGIREKDVRRVVAGELDLEEARS